MKLRDEGREIWIRRLGRKRIEYVLRKRRMTSDGRLLVGNDRVCHKRAFRVTISIHSRRRHWTF
jgi:hypothetical protein